jgi:ABC-type glycerol-3-phosphate transport system substrate-binding protein
MDATRGENVMTHAYRLTRRAALKTAVAGAALPLVHIRTGHAAGKLSVAFWDHWVPEGNAVMQKQCAEWGAKNQVDVQADFVTSN